MNLFNSNSKFLDRFFRRVNGLVWDLSTGKLGVHQPDGIYTCDVTVEGTGTNTTSTGQISINPFDQFGIAIPAFASNTPLENVAVGDLIVGAKDVLGWVVEKKAASLVLLDTKGMQKQYNPPKVAMFGQDGVMVVKSLTGLLGGERAGDFQNMLMPLLVMGDGAGLDIEKLIPLMLFSQTNGNGNASGMAGMMQTVMMMQALGGPSGGSIGRGLTASPVFSGSTTGFGSAIPPLTRTR